MFFLNVIQMPTRVALFATCVGLATSSVLERLGFEISFPEALTCCGQPALNAGFRHEAGRTAAAFYRAMEGAKADYIVVPSGSYAAMITRHDAELADPNPLTSRTFEFSRFLI